MSKGFIFSIESFYATAFVIFLVGAFAFYNTHTPSAPAFIQSLNFRAHDAAIVAFYLGKNPSDFNNFYGTAPDANYSKCAILYTYDYNSADKVTTQGTVTPKKFCTGFG